MNNLTTSTLTTETLTTNEAAAAGAVLGGMFGIAGVALIAFIILLIVAEWKLLVKAGEKGWKSLIPIYNVYIFFKIAGAKTWFWTLFAVEIVASIVAIVGAANGGIVTDKNGNITEIRNPAYIISISIAAFWELVCYIVFAAKLSKAFKRGVGTAIGIFFLPNIFTLILAFGSTKYD